MRRLLLVLATLTALVGCDPGPRRVPACQDYAALLVKAEQTGQDWYLCIDSRYGTVRAAMDPEALPR